MHILFLTDNFHPEVNAPASRTFEHCREWVRHGYPLKIVRVYGHGHTRSAWTVG